MPREIYNLGRVVGYSAYELFVKQILQEDPNKQPPTEKEWLASTVSLGSSMLLKISANNSVDDSKYWVQDIMLPASSSLCAANTIIGSLFFGKGVYENNSKWASRVSDYGLLISNVLASSPSGTVGSSGNIPSQISDSLTDSQIQSYAQNIDDYSKIIDGIVIQPGTWSTSSNQPPQKTLSPNLAQVPRIRLLIKGKIKQDFEIILTGFTVNGVIAGTSGLDTSTETSSPYNGDFLGPAVFPWASKIVFSTTNAYAHMINTLRYQRKLPIDASYISVEDSPIIDMKSINPNEFYEQGSTSWGAKNTTPGTNGHRYMISYSSIQNIPVSVDVENMTDDSVSVLATYNKSTDKIFPPALWGGILNKNNGSNKLYPVDIVAPGSVKIFANTGQGNASSWPGYKYMQNYPGVFPLEYDLRMQFYSYLHGPTIPDNDYTKRYPIASISSWRPTYKNYLGDEYVTVPSGLDKFTGVKIKTGLNEIGVLALGTVDYSSGTPFTQYVISTDGSNDSSHKTLNGTVYEVGTQTKLTPVQGNINWATLLEALANDKSIDILGDNLKLFKAGLANGYIQLPTGAGRKFTFGENYIELENKIQLILSNETGNFSDVTTNIPATGKFTAGRNYLQLPGGSTLWFTGDGYKFTIDMNQIGLPNGAKLYLNSSMLGLLNGAKLNLATSEATTTITDEYIKLSNTAKITLTNDSIGLNNGSNLTLSDNSVQLKNGNKITLSTDDSFTLSNGVKVTTGTNFIQIGSGPRLYISKSAPTGTIPTGSIGIGW